MTDFDYKKYSLEQLDNWMHDAISGDATPDEIYDCILNVVRESYYHHKHHASQAYELLSKLNGHPTEYNWLDKQKNLSCDKDDTSPECQKSWNDFWEDVDNKPADKVVRWKLPVEVDGLTGECYVNFPDDLLEAANLKEGDQVQWVDNHNSSFTLKKVSEPLGMDEC